MWWLLLCVIIILEHTLAWNFYTHLYLYTSGKDVGVESGVVRGHLVDEDDYEYYAFLGIPYAAPPTFKNRFKAPRPPIPWKGIYNAQRIVKCPQKGTGDEDCLIVNVFTPTKIVNDLAPVLVYIHGGAFVYGMGQTGGVAPLLKQNILVVTLNYRLGALGFLCLGIQGAPGNAGLKDQVAALKWVKNNIQNFGGDPTQMTLYGMSAGATLVEFHVLSKISEGLFQRAVVESGSAILSWATDANPIDTARRFAEMIQIPKKVTKCPYNLVQRLQHEPADKLSQFCLEMYNNLTDETFGFAPCVEKKVFGEKPFISKSPYEILTKNDYKKVPMMFIIAASEGLFFKSAEYYELDYKNKMEYNFLDFLPADLILDTDEIKQEVGKNVKHFYFGNKTVGENNLINYLNYIGDRYVLVGILNSAERHAKDGNPVYLMEFAYKGGMGNYDQFYENVTVAGHGEFIKHAILNKRAQSQDDKLTVDRVAKLIANYVRFGNPTPTRTQLLPISWPRVRPDNVSYLYLNQDFNIFKKPYWDRKLFWDKLYSKFRRPIHPVDPEFC